VKTTKKELEAHVETVEFDLLQRMEQGNKTGYTIDSILTLRPGWWWAI